VLPMKFTPIGNGKTPGSCMRLRPGHRTMGFCGADRTQPLEALAQSDTRSLLAATIFGAGWGIGSVLFGLGVARVGRVAGVCHHSGHGLGHRRARPMLILHPGFVPPRRAAWFWSMVIVLVASA